MRLKVSKNREKIRDKLKFSKMSPIQLKIEFQGLG